MSAPPTQPPEQSPADTAGGAADPGLLMDQFLPRYDFAVVHADVFRAPPAECYRAVSELDLFQAPLVRALLGIRGLPQRVAGTLKGRAKTTALQASRPTFRVKDMVGLGWIQLGETPGVELVLGQVSRPWKAVAAFTDAPTTPEQFTSFGEPGFAKIAVSLRVDPYGNDSSILTVETRVAITDDESRRRFRRYWLLIGPSALSFVEWRCACLRLSFAGRFRADRTMVESDRENHARYGEVAGSLVGPCFTKLPDPKDHPVFQIVQRC